MHAAILKPVIVLVAWSLVMLGWLVVVRMPALRRAGVDIRTVTGNYNHLMEQPTLFYAVALTLAISGTGDGLNATLAWAYVALRVAHSLVQAIHNRVVIRFGLFALSTVSLATLTVHAAIRLW